MPKDHSTLTLKVYVVGCVLGVSAGWLGAFGVDRCGSQVERPQPASAKEVKPLERQPWTTSRITGAPEPPPPFRVERIFPKLKFHQPVDMTCMPGGDRLFIVEQAGKVYSFPAKSDVEKADSFLDLAGDFKSLVPHPQSKGIAPSYGLVFHPNFAENRECFVTYGLAAKEGPPLKDGGRLSRFKVSGTDPPRCDPASEEVILTWLEGGHMGSAMAFGPDGMLYVSTGDAGPASPPDEQQYRAGRG